MPKAEISLPDGITTIAIREIAERIAKSLHPPISPSTPRQISRLTKIPTSQENIRQWCGGQRPFPVSLTTLDMQHLQNGAWKNLPPPEFPISEPDWQKYAAALEQSPPDGWQVCTETSSPSLTADLHRVFTEDDWNNAVIDAVAKGVLTPRNPTTLAPAEKATGNWLLDCVVTRDDLAKFADCHGVAITKTPDTEINTNEASESPSIPHVGLDGSPTLYRGKNDREKVAAWIEWSAKTQFKTDDTTETLAEKIKLAADKWGYESERGKLTVASIIRMLPKGITGGRGGRPKKK